MGRRLRRSMLFVPGNNPSMILNAPVFCPDSIILDLEDAVSINQKDAARELLVQALRTLNFAACEIVIRINGRHTPFAVDDIAAMVPARPHVLRLAMTEQAEDIIWADELVTKLEAENEIEPGSIKLMAAIETAKGVLNASEIATASRRLVAMSFGAEDFTNSIHSERTADGFELLAARSTIVLAARAANIDPIDTVYSKVDDDEGFIKDALRAKQMGFAGKSCIHPRQVELVHKVFRPSGDEIQRAIAVMSAIQEAEKRGSGVVSVDGHMVDGPIVMKAQRVLQLAQAAGLTNGGIPNDNGNE
jgi:citrate lyase subunit beta/citryl-CoA lyase